MKIIIVDDEIAALNTFLSHIVNQLDIEYKMFKNDPVSALNYAEKNEIDAAFLDISMPLINGITLAEKLIKINDNIRIVFITGYAQNEEEIYSRIGAHLKGYCYKPYEVNQLFCYLEEIKEECGEKRNIFLRTFGSFDLFIDNKAVRFSSAKSKELLALLTDKNGSQLSMSEAIAYLWPDKHIEHSKRLYRDAVYRLRLTLKEYNLTALVSFYRALLVINKNFSKCDLWELLDKKLNNKHFEQYMPNYSWSIETQSYLEQISLKNQVL